MEILTSLPSILQQVRHKIGIQIPIKGCIHIGAHEGQEYPVYKHFGFKNLLFYEALPKNFELLKKTVLGDSSVDIRNIALGNINGSIEMHIEDRGLSSSILKPKHHLEQYPQIKFDNTETVNITRLDDEKFDRSLFNFINIDVQGYELEVFKGAKETLNHIDMIISEINKEEMYDGCVLVEDLDKFLLNYGFKRMVTYWQQDGETWGDGLYLKA
jgi:FkbM family methyltransferase